MPQKLSTDQARQRGAHMPQGTAAMAACVLRATAILDLTL
jgi:hypothetical protein